MFQFKALVLPAVILHLVQITDHLDGFQRCTDKAGVGKTGADLLCNFQKRTGSAETGAAEIYKPYRMAQFL